MKVLGISYGYHDSSACLVVDGRIVAGAAEERFTRQKHDPNFPTYAIEHCLEKARLTPRDLDEVVFHEDPHAKFSRVLCAAVAPFPGSRKEFVNSVKAWLGRKLWSLNTISKRLNVAPDRISYLSHHFSHAVTGFIGSGFDEAAILIVDAVGDWACSALYKGAWVDGKPKIDRLLEIAYPNSLGLVYSAVTAYLGFNPNDSECSTMALAGFGRPIFADKIREIITKLDDDSYEVDQSYFSFQSFYRGPVTERFLKAFGPARATNDKLPFNCFSDGQSNGHSTEESISSDAQRFADVAASVQLVLEERVLGLAQKLHSMAPSENLCFAGGVSLNCVLNSRLLRESPFENIYIPPDPGDGGTAIGAALYCSALGGSLAPRSLSYSPYLGAEFDETSDAAMVKHIKFEHILGYLKRGLTLPANTRLTSKTFDSDEALCEEVSTLLMERNIVGWFNGRFELGPRALGNRSILVRPDDTALAERLSRTVKDRAAFRPYAFSVSEEDATKALAIDPSLNRMMRWMQYAVPVRPEIANQVRAALHVDGTTRVQVCNASENPTYHALLTTFGRKFGIGTLLNTSFNPSGYPIVATPVEAMAMFVRTGMDALVLNRTLIRKEVG